MKPFRIEISDHALNDLAARLRHTRWPEDLGFGWERGVPEGYLRELVRYWGEEYDWRAAETKLNSYPQFTTEIDDATIHYVHVKSPEPNAVPLLLTHGWPSSFVEFLGVIGPLSDPRAHGLDPSLAFDLVIPSIPGFGFSQPVRPGWNVFRIGAAWAELMRRLGYQRYLVQGGDMGSMVSLAVGWQDAEHVLGVHVNMLLVFPPQDPAALAGLSEDDLGRLGKLARFDAELAAYMKLQSTRPVTLSYALTDSPAGQLAWIVERYKEWTAPNQVPEDVVDRDQMLTNVALYWFTSAAGPSAQLYYESAEGMRMAATGAAPPPMQVPLGVAVFHEDICVPVRALAEKHYPNITHWTEYEHGGHFAAMERPADFVNDVRAFTASLVAGQERLAS